MPALTGGSAGNVGCADAATPGPPGVTSNGEVLLQFACHADAVAAAHELRGAKLLGMGIYEAGGALVVGWGSPEDWLQARPRLPPVI